MSFQRTRLARSATAPARGRQASCFRVLVSLCLRGLVATTLLVAGPAFADSTVLYYDFQDASGVFENAPELLMPGLTVSSTGWDPSGSGPDFGVGNGGGSALYIHGFINNAENMTLVNLTVQPGYSFELTDYSFDLVADSHAGENFGFFIIPLGGGGMITLCNGVPLIRDEAYHTYSVANIGPGPLPVTLTPGGYNIALVFGVGQGGGYVGLDNFRLLGSNGTGDPNDPNDPVDPNNPVDPNAPVDPNNPGDPNSPNNPGDPLDIGYHTYPPEPAAQVVTLGAGSYGSGQRTGYKTPTNMAGTPLNPRCTATFAGPMPTNDWWTSIGYPFFQGDPHSPWSSLLMADPLHCWAAADGLELAYITTPTYDAEYHFRYARDMTIGVAGLAAPNTFVDDYGDWTVRAYWHSGTSTFRATFGHGLPFVYCTKSGASAQIAFAAAPLVWYRDGGTLGVTVRGHHYGIFAPTGAGWTTGSTIRSSLAGQDYFSVAVLPDSSIATLLYYQQFAFAFVTDTHVSWSYDDATAELTSVYTATTTPKEGTTTDTLMALYPHQWKSANEPLTPYTYIGARGTLKVFAGSAFSTTMTFNGVLPALPDLGTYDRTTLYSYVNDVHLMGNAVPDGNDTYWTGKNLNRAAQLVHIADQVGHTAARDHFLGDMKTKLANWLTYAPGEAQSFFLYNNAWGALTGYPANYGSDTELSDHQFHYGYWLVAAATIARYDPNFVRDENYGAMLKLLARDAAADHDDPLFPFLRNFDPYAGHAWASGHGAFVSGNNQESASESLNFATGMILLGSALGDQALRDRGIFMYVNEVRAVEQYWFDVDQENFPDLWQHPNVTILWGDGGTYSTWFSAEPEKIHGIIFLPITGGSLYLGRRPDYVLRNYNHMIERIGGPENSWPDIIWSFLALADPASAVSKFAARPNYTPEEGESKAHTYHWLHNLNAVGHVDTTVTADVATYAVFNKAGRRTYVGYNPSGTARVVRFSDGAALALSPYELRGVTTPDCAGLTPADQFAAFDNGMAGPDQPLDVSCVCAHADGDSDADLLDFAQLQAGQ